MIKQKSTQDSNPNNPNSPSSPNNPSRDNGGIDLMINQERSQTRFKMIKTWQILFNHYSSLLIRSNNEERCLFSNLYTTKFERL